MLEILRYTDNPLCPVSCDAEASPFMNSEHDSS